MLQPIDFQNSVQVSTAGQIQLLSVMHEINRKLLSGASYQKLLDLVFESIDSIIPFDRIGIALVEGAGDEARLSMKWVRSKIAFSHLNLSFSSPVKGSSLEKILKTGEPRIINDLVEYAKFHPESIATQLIIQDGIRSNFTCPLSAGGKQIGVVFFSSATANTYFYEHIQTFREVANELSLIVDHGRLKKDFDTAQAQSRNLSMILHDLKSPLGVIQGYTEASYDEPWYQNLDKDCKDVFKVLLRNSKYMFDLLNELNEIAELDRRSDLVIPMDVNLTEFYHEMVDLGERMAVLKEIKFVAAPLNSAIHTLRFDKYKVQRVLDNFFSNAVKYSTRRSSIFFSVVATSKKLTFQAQDQGPGIPEEELPKLFHEFGKTSVRPTEGEASTGLGLAIAKKIISQHEGEISVESKVGVGSTFAFWIPVSGATIIH